MKINKRDLQAALEKVKPGLANKEIIEQSTHFAFMGDRVVTYNDEISISCQIPNLNITGAVSANEWYQSLNKTKADEIEMEISEEEIQLKAGKGKAGLTLHSKIVLPLAELGEQTEWVKLPEDVLQALNFCRFSCSKDMSKPVLTCVEVNEAGFAQSCDNYRITRHDFTQKKKAIKTFLIPGTSAQELVRYAASEICYTTGWVHFRTADKTVTFSCRIFEDNYPDTTAIRVMKDPIEIKIPEKLQEILERVEIFAKTQFGTDSLVDVIIKDKRVLVQSKNQSGWSEEECPIRYTGNPIEFSINPQFLQDMLPKIKACSIDNTKMQFKGDGWEHIVALTGKA